MLDRIEKGDRRKRGFIYLLSLFLGLLVIIEATPLQGQETKYPTKAIEIVVPYAPGGMIDVVNRIFAEYLSKELKVPVLIKNYQGGGGLTGVNAFLGNKPDGYSILSTSGSSITTSVLLAKTPPFDPKKDLLPLGQLGGAPVAMSVTKTSPFKSIGEFIRFAKANPQKSIAGIADLGGETHFMSMGIIKDAKIDVKIVPFAGSAALSTALLGGHVDWKCSSLPSTMAYLKSGDLRVLLLTHRSKNLPDIPAGTDVGLPSVMIDILVGFYIHPEAPKAAYERLVSAIEKAAKNPELAKKLDATGLDTEYKGPREVSKSIDDYLRISSEIIKEMNLKAD